MKRFFNVVAIGLVVVFLLNAFCIYLSASPISDNVEFEVDIYRKHENEFMKIALTFDDGPHPRHTPQILDLLDRYEIKATFFSVGINAYYYPDVLAEIAARGHEIGNHTYSHPHVNQVNQVKLEREIEKCEEMIYQITDRKTKLFRPPEGMIDSEMLKTIHNLDYRIILWDIDTRDWAHTSPEEIAKNVIEKTSSGDIILMHDYIGRNSPTYEAMEIFIPVLIEKGYKFVVVSELIDSN